MLALLIFAATAATPTLPSGSGMPNPRASELFERDPALMAWALKQYDANHDGWLTSFEASRAAEAFRALADTDHDGRVTLREYQNATAYISVRY